MKSLLQLRLARPGAVLLCTRKTQKTISGPSLGTSLIARFTSPTRRSLFVSLDILPTDRSNFLLCLIISYYVCQGSEFLNGFRSAGHNGLDDVWNELQHSSGPMPHGGVPHLDHMYDHRHGSQLQPILDGNADNSILFLYFVYCLLARTRTTIFFFLLGLPRYVIPQKNNLNLVVQP